MSRCAKALVLLSLIAACSGVAAYASDVIVFTAHQEFDSRIYVMDLDGTVYRYFEYEFFRFTDVEVVGGELYVAEAFAPRAERVNLTNGDLEVIIDDWSLFYFYDLAWDGTHFYVDEWDLNRYTIDGSYAGTASFDESVMGSTHDGEHFWTLDNAGNVKCWDLTGWPTVTALPALDFPAPTADCRGLWHDGRYFWTAESRETVGWIFQFDDRGNIVRQLIAPAFSGWAACVVHDFISDVPVSPGDVLADLEPNYPNPFNPITTIAFTLSHRVEIVLAIHDVRGRRVATLREGMADAGHHLVDWNAEGLPSGVYYCSLEAGGARNTRKLSLIR